MKLTDSVHLVGGSVYGLSALGDCNIYLVNCGNEYALIDTGGGMGVKRIIENIKYDGFDPKKIKLAFLTHCHFDHIGGGSRVQTVDQMQIDGPQTRGYFDY